MPYGYFRLVIEYFCYYLFLPTVISRWRDIHYAHFARLMGRLTIGTKDTVLMTLLLPLLIVRQLPHRLRKFWRARPRPCTEPLLREIAASRRAGLHEIIRHHGYWAHATFSSVIDVVYDICHAILLSSHYKYWRDMISTSPLTAARHHYIRHISISGIKYGQSSPSHYRTLLIRMDFW